MLGRYFPPFLKVLDHLFGKLIRVRCSRKQMQFRLQGGLVRVVNPGEARELAGTGLAVQAFGVPRFTHRQRCIDKDLDKVARRICLDECPNRIAILPIGADKRRQGHDSGLRKELGDGTDPPNVFRPVWGGKAQSETRGEGVIILLGKNLRRRVQSVPDVVTIEQRRVNPPCPQLPIDQVRHRTLAATAEPGEPKHTAPVAFQLLALGTRYIHFMPHHMR